MVVRMRHTRSQRGNTRSHHAISTKAPVSLCKECGSPKSPHVVCSVCGKYKGRQVLNVQKSIDKKSKKSKASK